MAVKELVREFHTFQPGPFGWCCYDCNEGEASALPSRFPASSESGEADALPSQRDVVNLPSPGHARMHPRAATSSSGLPTPRDTLPMAG